jgi:pimeloyl-ACP methyl ester carboxylesterase
MRLKKRWTTMLHALQKRIAELKALPRSGSCDGWHRVKRPDPRQRFRFFLMVLEEARRPSCNLQVARSKERKQSPKEAENTMAKQIFFIHGAGNQHHPDGSGKLVASLKRELGSDYEVLAPDMPDPDHPAYKAWRDQIGQELGRLDPDVLLIGHSFGGSVLLKYLAEGTGKCPSK